LLNFFGKPANLGVVKACRQPQVFIGELALDFFVLTVDVAGVFGGDFYLFGDALSLWERVPGGRVREILS
jgi:hypothetical protein